MNNNFKLNSIVTLRDTMRLKYSVAFSFHRVLLHTDLPYDFNQERKYWWRWYSDIYGFFYNRVKRSYSIWLTMYLKHNIGVYISFLFKMPGKHSHILDDWKRRAFLYSNTLQKRHFFFKINNFTSLNFWTINYLDLSEAARNILFPGNKRHRAMGSPGVSGLDLDTFISSYNGKWNNLYRPESMFYNTSRMPRDFFVVVNSFFISSGFFISSFDSLLILYPQFFLEYNTKLYNQKILNLISFFIYKFNIFFYLNILILILYLYFEFFKFKFIKYVQLNIFFNFDIYKINLYIYFIRYYYFLLKNTMINQLWILFSIFFNKFQLKNFVLIQNNYLKKINNYKYIYMIYFFNYLNDSNIWLNKTIKKNNYYNWKYEFFFKYLNNFKLYKSQDLNQMSKFVIFKKLYIFEWIHFWKFLNNWNLNFNNIKRKKQSLFFINRYINLINIKYGNIPNVFKLLKFFNNLKEKYLNNNKFLLRNYRFIKPSVLVKKYMVHTKLRGMNNYGKYFVKVSDLYIQKKTISIFYSIMQSTSRALLYLKYSRNFLKKLSNFIKTFFFLIISVFKINFGFSYNLISNKKIYSVSLDNKFFYNIQYYLYLFLFFLRRFFIKNKTIINKSFLNTKLKFSNKVFFFFFYLIPKTNVFKFNIQKNYFKYFFKGMNLNKLSYVKFFNNNNIKNKII